MADTETQVDVSEAVEAFQRTITALEEEVATEERELEERLGVKRARLAALKRGLKAAEQAADPDIEPVKKPGRTRKAEEVAA
jgi:hypothetical protein